MALLPFVEEDRAPPEVAAIYADIKRTRGIDWINNFWKVLANDPATLRRTWESVKEVMAPGALDARTKEMIYLAVSIANNCDYCAISHNAAARKAGMTEAMFAELVATIGMASETNRLAIAYRIEPDAAFLAAAGGSKTKA